MKEQDGDDVEGGGGGEAEELQNSSLLQKVERQAFQTGEKCIASLSMKVAEDSQS
jgi:hypothetical protein